jgi:general secretion pathway protein D
MEVAQEISSVANQTTDNTPTISRRRVSSSVSVNDGQTIVLAGLISTTKEKGRSGLPVLSRLAGVGDAFGTNTKGAVRNELVVLIRPQIIRNGEDAQSVAEDLRSKMWGIGQRERVSP